MSDIHISFYLYEKIQNRSNKSKRIIKHHINMQRDAMIIAHIIERNIHIHKAVIFPHKVNMKQNIIIENNIHILKMTVIIRHANITQYAMIIARIIERNTRILIHQVNQLMNFNKTKYSATRFFFEFHLIYLSLRYN
jgi:hypothetical protein